MTLLESIKESVKETVCVTQGVVSRIDLHSYSWDSRLLVVQIDAAINPGNRRLHVLTLLCLDEWRTKARNILFWSPTVESNIRGSKWCLREWYPLKKPV